MFENVAPVLPEAALAALERAVDRDSDAPTMVWYPHLSLLRSLAYDAPLFEQSTQMVAKRCDAKTPG